MDVSTWQVKDYRWVQLHSWRYIIEGKVLTVNNSKLGDTGEKAEGP